MDPFRRFLVKHGLDDHDDDEEYHERDDALDLEGADITEARERVQQADDAVKNFTDLLLSARNAAQRRSHTTDLEQAVGVYKNAVASLNTLLAAVGLPLHEQHESSSEAEEAAEEAPEAAADGDENLELPSDGEDEEEEEGNDYTRKERRLARRAQRLQENAAEDKDMGFHQPADDAAKKALVRTGLASMRAQTQEHSLDRSLAQTAALAGTLHEVTDRSYAQTPASGYLQRQQTQTNKRKRALPNDGSVVTYLSHNYVRRLEDVLTAQSNHGLHPPSETVKTVQQAKAYFALIMDKEDALDKKARLGPPTIAGLRDEAYRVYQTVSEHLSRLRSYMENVSKGNPSKLEALWKEQYYNAESWYAEPTWYAQMYRERARRDVLTRHSIQEDNKKVQRDPAMPEQKKKRVDEMAEAVRLGVHVKQAYHRAMYGYGKQRVIEDSDDEEGLIDDVAPPGGGGPRVTDAMVTATIKSNFIQAVERPRDNNAIREGRKQDIAKETRDAWVAKDSDSEGSVSGSTDSEEDGDRRPKKPFKPWTKPPLTDYFTLKCEREVRKLVTRKQPKGGRRKSEAEKLKPWSTKDEDEVITWRKDKLSIRKSNVYSVKSIGKRRKEYLDRSFTEHERTLKLSKLYQLRLARTYKGEMKGSSRYIFVGVTTHYEFPGMKVLFYAHQDSEEEGVTAPILFRADAKAVKFFLRQIKTLGAGKEWGVQEDPEEQDEYIQDAKEDAQAKRRQDLARGAAFIAQFGPAGRVLVPKDQEKEDMPYLKEDEQAEREMEEAEDEAAYEAPDQDYGDDPAVVCTLESFLLDTHPDTPDFWPSVVDENLTNEPWRVDSVTRTLNEQPTLSLKNGTLLADVTHVFTINEEAHVVFSTARNPHNHVFTVSAYFAFNDDTETWGWVTPAARDAFVAQLSILPFYTEVHQKQDEDEDDAVDIDDLLKSTAAQMAVAKAAEAKQPEMLRLADKIREKLAARRQTVRKESPPPVQQEEEDDYNQENNGHEDYDYGNQDNEGGQAVAAAAEDEIVDGVAYRLHGIVRTKRVLPDGEEEALYGPSEYAVTTADTANVRMKILLHTLGFIVLPVLKKHRVELRGKTLEELFASRNDSPFHNYLYRIKSYVDGEIDGIEGQVDAFQLAAQVEDEELEDGDDADPAHTLQGLLFISLCSDPLDASANKTMGMGLVAFSEWETELGQSGTLPIHVKALEGLATARLHAVLMASIWRALSPKTKGRRRYSAYHFQPGNGTPDVRLFNDAFDGVSARLQGNDGDVDPIQVLAMMTTQFIRNPDTAIPQQQANIAIVGALKPRQGIPYAL